MNALGGYGKTEAARKHRIVNNRLARVERAIALMCETVTDHTLIDETTLPIRDLRDVAVKLHELIDRRTRR